MKTMYDLIIISRNENGEVDVQMYENFDINDFEEVYGMITDEVIFVRLEEVPEVKIKERLRNG